MTHIRTLKDLKTYLDDIPDHWLDTGLSFEFQGLPLTENDTISVTILHTRNTLAVDIKEGFYYHMVGEDEKAELDMADYAEQQMLAALASVTVNNYGQRDKLLEKSRLEPWRKDTLRNAYYGNKTVEELLETLNGIAEGDGPTYSPAERSEYRMLRNLFAWADRCRQSELRRQRLMSNE